MQIPTNNSVRLNVALFAAIVILIFYFVKCGPDPVAPAQPVNTPAKIEKQIVKDSAASKRIVDSMQKQVIKWKLEAASLKRDVKGYQELVNSILSQSDSIVNDTNIITRYQMQVQLDLIKLYNNAKDSAFSYTIGKQDSIITTLEATVNEKDLLQSKMRTSVNDLQSVITENEALIKHWKKQYRKKAVGQSVFKLTTAAAAVVIFTQILKN